MYILFLGYTDCMFKFFLGNEDSGVGVVTLLLLCRYDDVATLFS
jgi:hypothetical protein